MKNKNIKNKPQKCGRWLFLHSRFSKISRGGPRTPLIKRMHQLNPQNLSSTTAAAKDKKKAGKPSTINPSHAAIKISINATAAEFICKNIFPTPMHVKKNYKK